MLAANRKLYTASQVRQLDMALAAARDVATWQLMQDAATAAFRIVKANWPEAKRITIMTGSGNNAGDGWALAGLLHQVGCSVTVLAVRAPDKLTGDAALAVKAAIDAGCEWQLWGAMDNGSIHIRNCELIVDALLGTGIKGELREEYATAVNVINNSDKPVLALDLPTGLDADTGAIQGVCVQAVMTITFVAYKRGQLTLNGPDYCGLLSLADLGLRNYPELPEYTIGDAAVDNLDPIWLNSRLKPRKHNSHKKSYGHVVVIAGNSGMAGAGLLAATAALRCGAGLVTLLTHTSHADSLYTACPELMLKGIDASGQLPVTLLQRADAIVVGPGLGQDRWAQQVWRSLVDFLGDSEAADMLPVVIDADGLMHMTAHPLPGCHKVLTPHPGEAARLLGGSGSSIQQDRFASATELAEQYDSNIILKGNGTVIAGCDRQLAVSATGNPGMATAGMGDVLAGVCGAMLAQNPKEVTEMVRCATVLHGMAGDMAAAKGQYGLLASDVINSLIRILP